MRITVPNLNTNNALSFSQSLVNLDYDDTYIFDVSRISNYEPLPMLLTAAAIRHFCTERSLDPWQIQLVFNEDKNYRYACHMAFFQAAGFVQGKAPGEAPGSASYIPLTKIDIAELTRKAFEKGDWADQGDIVELEAKRLSWVLSQGEVEFEKLLQYLLREAIRNIPEHSGTSEAWLCGQYWHNRNLAEIAILDEGIGVYNSLSKNRIHRNYITTNEDALRWALKPGVSTAFHPARGQRSQEPWANSGYGLYMISEICKATDGWFTFVSGDDCMRVYPNTSSLYKAHYNGTALGIRVNTSRITKYQTIIDDAMVRGMSEAKTIENAFKTASIPSRGLIY